MIVHPDQVQMLETAAPAMSEAAANVGRAREPNGSRVARRWRQEPPCFDGKETVRRLRPFLRRRERTARPHRVAIRARNPCLVMRRLFRGRYDGFIEGFLPSEPGKLVGRERWGQVEAKKLSTLLHVFNVLHFFPVSLGSIRLASLLLIFFCQVPIDIFIPRP
jgi:hypothetical protein